MIGGLKETGRGARTEVRTSCHHPNNKKEPLPDGYDRPDKPLRYCQAIMLARKREILITQVDKQTCPIGASANGLEPLSEKMRSGEFHHNMGKYLDL
jgi:uncharacterized protein (DUF169 family)